MNYRSLIGFTLAEVLITLGIIGIVAEMTIPSLVNSYQNQIYVTSFKEEFAIMSSAWQQLITENGGYIAGVYPTADSALDGLCTKMKCTTICHSSDDQTKCFLDTNWLMLNKGAAWQSILGPSAILANGFSFSILGFSSDCSSARYKAETCFVTYFDTNSFKKPNIMGRDIFEVFVNQNNITPQGVAGTGGETFLQAMCDPNGASGYKGASCGARILIENGMKY